jgi:phage baseplate assembly protein W
MSSNSNLYDKIKLPAVRTLDNTSSKIYKGFSTVNQSSENFSLFDFELIKQDIINHFHVRQGEKLMDPLFGTIIWDMLYEPLTDEVKYVITENVNTIINYDPRVIASRVTVTSYESGIQIECMLTYRLYNIQQELQLRFDQNNGLLVA